jgi:hypothetical protein
LRLYGTYNLKAKKYAAYFEENLMLIGLTELILKKLTREDRKSAGFGHWIFKSAIINRINLVDPDKTHS